MKKAFTLLTIAVISFCIKSSAQCTLGPADTIPGLYPDDLPTGIINKAYSAEATVRFPIDTLVSLPPFGTFLIPYDSIQITNIYNLPAGLTWNCGTPDCKAYAGNLIACATISGTPTDTTNSVLPIQAELTGWLTAPIVGVQSGTGTQNLLIDIIPTPTTSITAFTNTSDHGTTVQWTSDASGDANDKWVLRHHKFGNSPNFLYKVTGPLATSAYTNNLEANTQYVYRAGFRASGNTNAAFSDTASVWTRCASPTGFSAFRSGPSTAELSWTDVNSDLYKVRYRPLGSASFGVAVWSYKNVSGPADGTTLTGLSIDDYIWQVRSVCDHGATSYASSQILPGGGARLAGPQSEDVELYPNPTQGSITMNIPALNDGSVTANFLDISGRTILNEQINLFKGVNRHSMDLSDMRNGIYILQLNNNGSITSHRIVKH